MSQELFPYYESELSYLRELGHEFARAHRGAASALLLDESVPIANRDPHVERLLQGVALLNARIRHRLDDDFPQLSETLLNTLYPQYLAPFPSCSILQFGMDEGQLGPDAAQGEHIGEHSTLEFSSASSPGAPLRYRTAYPVQLLPIRISALRFSNDRFEAPTGTRHRSAASALQIDLETLSPEISWNNLAQMAFRSETEARDFQGDLPIRFFLHGHNQSRIIHGLYDLFLKSNLRVVAWDPARNETVTLHSPQVMSPVGFREEESLLPRDGRIMQGFRILQEYFAFSQKFQFVELRLPRACLKNVGTKLQLIVMSSEENAELAEMIQRDDLRLGCCPIVNLFPMRADFPLTYRQAEYRLIVDAGAPLDYEVFQVNRVRVHRHGREIGEFQSFYDVYHGAKNNSQGYWHVSRKSEGGAPQEDAYLSLVDHAVHPTTLENATVSVDVLCANRNVLTDDLGLRVDPVTGRPSIPIQLTSGRDGGVAQLVIRPTQMLSRKGSADWKWRLCSHLALNQVSLSSLSEGGAALKEILRLYNLSENPLLKERIEGLDEVQLATERVTKRVAPGPHGFAQGNRVTLAFRESNYPDGGLFLFANVLRYFLASYTTINSFVETRYRTVERNREFNSWPALAGTRPLL